MTTEYQARFKAAYEGLQPRGRMAKLESALGRVAPGLAMRRERQRVELAKFRAQGAYPNAGRANASPFENSPFRVQREQRQLLWNAIELIDNSGLAESITSKVELYTVGSLRYQARTGDPGVNKLYEDYIREKSGPGVDIEGETTLRKMCGIAIRGRIVKGGAVFDLIRSDPDDPDIHLRGIEYDRIGSPWDFTINPNYVGGFHLGPGGKKVAVDIFNRDRMGGCYTFGETIPIFDEFGRRQVMHLYRRTAFDPHKGVTSFKTAIDNVHYIDQIRKYELQAMQWAATQTAVQFTQTGELVERPFDNQTHVGPDGQPTRIINVHGPEISAMTVGEDVKMFESNRPSPNVIAMFTNTINEVCMGAGGLPMVFVTGMQGTGPAVRFEGCQADRAIGSEFTGLDEQLLTPWVHAELQNGIRNGDIPYHPLYKRGRFIGPAKPSIDTGYDSAAAINENKEGITSRSSILLDRSIDEDEEADQIEAEAEDWIDRAKRIAKQEGCTWQEVIPMLRQSSGASGGVASTLPSPVTAPKDPNAGATSDGVDLDPEHTQKELKALRASMDTVAAEIRSAKFGTKDANGDEHGNDGKFVPTGGGGAASKRSVKAQPGELHEAKRQGAGKDAKIVLADGSDAPEHIQKIAGQISPARSHNLRISLDPNAQVLAKHESEDGKKKFTIVHPDLVNSNAANKFARVNEAVEKGAEIHDQIQRDRQGPNKEEADAAYLMEQQATRPGSENDTKGNKGLWNEPVSAKDFTVEPQKKGPPKVTLNVGGSSIPLRDEGAREEISNRIATGKPLENAGYWIKSHGATTLEGRHVVPTGDGGTRLQFMGKESVWHDHEVKDKGLAAMLLQRKVAAGDAGKLFNTNETKVGNYVGTLAGGGLSNKDLRTKRANELARDMIAAGPKEFAGEDDRKKHIMDVANHVSGVLGNDPKQALESYIDPHRFSELTVKA